MSATRTNHPWAWSTRLLLSGVALGCAGWALAQPAPPSFVASPEIYKVIAENDKYRVIEVVWKPGQKDKPHSHPDAAVYYVNNCSLRNDFGNGNVATGAPVAGAARVQGPIGSHTIENIGSSDCRLIMFEPK